MRLLKIAKELSIKGTVKGLNIINEKVNNNEGNIGAIVVVVLGAIVLLAAVASSTTLTTWFNTTRTTITNFITTQITAILG